MANSIDLFRKLSSDMIGLISESPFTFSYTDEEEIVELESSPINPSYRSFTVKDTAKGLRPDDFSMTVEKTITIINCDKWFLPTGVACQDSEIGYALIWKSHDSKLRGCAKLGTIQNTQACQVLNVNHTFPKGCFRGCLDLSIVIYLKSLGYERRTFICDMPGAILGEITKSSFYFDGNGSMFPIVTYEDYSNPLLWIVDFSCVDPEDDAFSDSVVIKLNKSHRDYEKVLFGQKKFDKNLFVEIIASALTIIVSSLREEYPTVWANMSVNGYTAANGSICQVIKYMMDTFDLDFTDANRTSITLRQYLHRKINLS